MIRTIADRSHVRLRRRARAAQSDVLLPRRAGRQHGRRAAGHGPARHHLDPVAADFRHEAGRRHPDAGRRHVWRAIRRRDLLDPAQSAVPSAPCGDLSRRLPDDQARPRRRCARAHGVRLVRRRLLGHHRDDLPVAAVGEGGAAIRSSRSLLADVARPPGRFDVGARFADQGRGDDGSGPVSRLGRHRPRNRLRALHLRHDRARRRHRADRAGARPVRHRRVHEQRQSSRADQHQIHQCPPQGHAADQGRYETGVLPDVARHHHRSACARSFPAPGRPSPLSSPMRRKRRSRKRRNNSAPG